MPNIYILISFMGGGKTFLTKEICKKNKLPNYIYDVNGEYEDFPKSRIETNFKKFFANILEKRNDKFLIQKTNIIFEDSTGELSGKMEDDFKKIAIAKRHTGNNLIFLFHSIEDVPPFIFRMANFIILFKTGDLEESVKRKQPILLPAFNKLKNAPYLWDSVNKKNYSPKIIIKKNTL